MHLTRYVWNWIRPKLQHIIILKKKKSVSVGGNVRSEEDILYQEYTYVTRRERGSPGIVSPFSLAPVCKLVCMFVRELEEIRGEV